MSSGALALLITLSGCGYLIGPGNDPHITTVEVPVFGNETFRRGIELQLTESVQKEIQKRSFIRIAKGCDAETRLTGTIKQIRKQAVGRTAFADARQLELSILVEVTWENVSTGEVISEYSVPLDQATTSLFTSSNFAPEIGHSLATAVHDNVQQAATQIVDMMDAPW